MIRENLVNAVAQSNKLSKEDTIILQYGLKKIVMFMGDAVFTIIVGWLLRITALSIAFQIVFVLLRMYAGGYHSKTEQQCAVHSAIVTVISLLSIRWMISRSWWSGLLFIFVSIVIMVLAPVEAENKPLSVKEKTINHRKTIGIVLLFDLITIVSHVFNWNLVYAISAAIYAACILMIMGISVQRNDKRKSRKIL